MSKHTLLRDDIPIDMPTTNRPINIGRSLNDQTSRLDAVAKVTGRAKYGRDRYLDNQIFGTFIRCPFGAGRLESYDVDAARAVPGVLEVEVTGDHGRYHGHTVGHIAAESKTALRRAMRALNARWSIDDVKTGITDEDAALGEISEETQALLDQADHVLDADYSTEVQTHSALETHGAVVVHDGEHATAYISTQGASAAADGLGEALGLAQSNFEVICEYVGGGFGAKLGGPGKEGMLAARLAAKYRRPVSVFVDRDEEHLDTGNRPSSRSVVRIGFNNDGTIVGGRVATYGGVGVARGGGGVRFPANLHRLGTIDKSHNDVQFNSGGPRAFRAPGWPQGVFAEELMIDEVCARAGLDPLDVRMRLDTETLRTEMYEVGADLIGWNRRLKTGTQSGVIRRGFGMGAADWGRFPASAEVDLVVNRDGSVEVRTGTQDIGTGQRTVVAVLAAHALGINLARVSVKIGSTRYPPGPASGGSMTSHNTAPAVFDAAAKATDRLLKTIADRLGIDASDLELRDGSVWRNDKQIVSWDDACKQIAGEQIIVRGENSRETFSRYGGQGDSFGAQFAEITVDTETGVVRVERVVAVQACGQVVCRKTAESQIIGGVIQGISYALFEHKWFDRHTGAMVNPNLEWYKIAGPNDMPLIQPVLWTKGQTGVRSLGEPPTIPTSGAIACAVLNAIGAPVRHLPITPDKVLAALEGDAA